MELKKRYLEFVFPYLKNAETIRIGLNEKRTIIDIILKKLKVENIHKALDIPDFRLQFGKSFVNIAFNRYLKRVFQNSYSINVINSRRFLRFDSIDIQINYFELGKMPILDLSHNHHLIIGFDKIEGVGTSEVILYIFGELHLPNHFSENKKRKFILENTLMSGKYFSSFNLLTKFNYDKNKKGESKVNKL